MKSLVDIEDALHPVTAGGNIVQAYRRISKRERVENRGRAGSKSFHIHTESLLRFSRVKAELEARFFFVVVGNQQQHVAVERRGAHLFGKRNFEASPWRFCCRMFGFFRGARSRA